MEWKKSPNLFGDAATASATIPGKPLEDYLSDANRREWIRDHESWMSGRGFVKRYSRDRYGHIISWYEREYPC